jgi:hypothetical protein
LEINGKIVGTHWVLGENEKNAPPPPPKTLKGKKQGTLTASLGLSIDCMEFIFPKEFTIFGLG